MSHRYCFLIEDDCPYEGDCYAVQPVMTNWLDNLLNIAEYYGERSWDFYKRDVEELKKIVKEDWNNRFGGTNPSDSDKERKKKYLQSPEAMVVLAANFAVRPGSAYGILKERLEESVKNKEQFILDDEWTRLRDLYREAEYLREEIKEIMYGWRPGQAALKRILALAVDGASEFIPIAKSKVGPYFPELIAIETEEIAGADAA